MPRDKVLATIVRLLDTTLIRVGSEEYARDNRSYGLTTLRKKHLKIDRRHACASSFAARAASSTTCR